MRCSIIHVTEEQPYNFCSYGCKVNITSEHSLDRYMIVYLKLKYQKCEFVTANCVTIIMFFKNFDQYQNTQNKTYRSIFLASSPN